jgi:adenylyltransferase/sulfurtransferase
MKRPTVSLRSVTYVAKAVTTSVEGEDRVTDRQERVPGFVQRKLSVAKILLIGAGGLGSEVGEGLLRKGVGTLMMLDPDTVEVSNLNRQRFFKEDLYQNKAISLAKNLVREATLNSSIVAHPWSFETAVRKGIDMTCDMAVCVVDNNGTRLNASIRFRDKVPVVFIGVDDQADHGYVFVQEPKGPCFACLFPHVLDERNGNGQCAKSAAVKDILKLVGGVALYAVDTLLMPRKRAWNFREFSLAGFVPDSIKTIGERDDCPMCRGELIKSTNEWGLLEG